LKATKTAISSPARHSRAVTAKGTYEEAMANIKDAMRLHLEDRLANGEEFPEAVSVSLSTVEVSV